MFIREQIKQLTKPLINLFNHNTSTISTVTISQNKLLQNLSNSAICLGQISTLFQSNSFVPSFNKKRISVEGQQKPKKVDSLSCFNVVSQILTLCQIFTNNIYRWISANSSTQQKNQQNFLKQTKNDKIKSKCDNCNAIIQTIKIKRIKEQIFCTPGIPFYIQNKNQLSKLVEQDDQDFLKSDFWDAINNRDYERQKHRLYAKADPYLCHWLAQQNLKQNKYYEIKAQIQENRQAAFKVDDFMIENLIQTMVNLMKKHLNKKEISQKIKKFSVIFNQFYNNNFNDNQKQNCCKCQCHSLNKNHKNKNIQKDKQDKDKDKLHKYVINLNHQNNHGNYLFQEKTKSKPIQNQNSELNNNQVKNVQPNSKDLKQGSINIPISLGQELQRQSKNDDNNDKKYPSHKIYNKNLQKTSKIKKTVKTVVERLKKIKSKKNLKNISDNSNQVYQTMKSIGLNTNQIGIQCDIYNQLQIQGQRQTQNEDFHGKKQRNKRGLVRVSKRTDNNDGSTKLYNKDSQSLSGSQMNILLDSEYHNKPQNSYFKIQKNFELESEISKQRNKNHQDKIKQKYYKNYKIKNNDQFIRKQSFKKQKNRVSLTVHTQKQNRNQKYEMQQGNYNQNESTKKLPNLIKRNSQSSLHHQKITSNNNIHIIQKSSHNFKSNGSIKQKFKKQTRPSKYKATLTQYSFYQPNSKNIKFAQKIQQIIRDKKNCQSKNLQNKENIISKGKVIRQQMYQKIFAISDLQLFGGLQQSYKYSKIKLYEKQGKYLKNYNQIQCQTLKILAHIKSLCKYRSTIFENVISFLIYPYETIQTNKIIETKTQKQNLKKILFYILSYHDNKCKSWKCQHILQFKQKILYNQTLSQNENKINLTKQMNL